MGARKRAIVVPPRGGRRFSIGPDRFTRKGTLTTHPGAFSVIEYEARPAALGPPPHLHRRFEEAWFVLEGEVEFWVAGDRTRARAGTYLCIPRGVSHTFRVVGKRPARWVGIFSPGRYVGLVEELGRLIPRDAPPDPIRLRRLFTKYDSELVAGVP